MGHVYSRPGEAGDSTPGRATRGLHVGTEWTTRVYERQVLQHQEGEVAPVPVGGCDWLV